MAKQSWFIYFLPFVGYSNKVFSHSEQIRLKPIENKASASIVRTGADVLLYIRYRLTRILYLCCVRKLLPYGYHNWSNVFGRYILREYPSGTWKRFD